MRIAHISFESQIKTHDGEHRVGCIVAIDADEEATGAMAAAKRFVSNELAKLSPDGVNEYTIKGAVAQRLAELAEKAKDDAMPF